MTTDGLAPAWLSAWFASGHAIDLLIAITAVEGLLLALHHRRTGLGVRPRDFAANLVSGLCLMAALRCAIADSGALWIAAWLAAAGLAHASDLIARWRH
ncbi:MAG: hypothetical protein KKC85_12815 [Gammaproteobacteria bacterium]|nr:hypothetical protein [Gammaproteobacteria bacterium]MBU1440383.1 hypothetical protein [Gammaproteobacteria bacterium]MBU2287309.1 hypothetical protein [Gammaproteobacteria bacterium]